MTGRRVMYAEAFGLDRSEAQRSLAAATCNCGQYIVAVLVDLHAIGCPVHDDGQP